MPDVRGRFAAEDIGIADYNHYNATWEITDGLAICSLIAEVDLWSILLIKSEAIVLIILH